MRRFMPKKRGVRVGGLDKDVGKDTRKSRMR
jgi:hypothetical protein